MGNKTEYVMPESKREFWRYTFAGMALQGLLAAKREMDEGEFFCDFCERLALEAKLIASAMIEELEEKK